MPAMYQAMLTFSSREKAARILLMPILSSVWMKGGEGKGRRASEACRRKQEKQKQPPESLDRPPRRGTSTASSSTSSSLAFCATTAASAPSASSVTLLRSSRAATCKEGVVETSTPSTKENDGRSSWLLGVSRLVEAAAVRRTGWSPPAYTGNVEGVGAVGRVEGLGEAVLISNSSRKGGPWRSRLLKSGGRWCRYMGGA